MSDNPKSSMSPWSGDSLSSEREKNGEQSLSSINSVKDDTNSTRHPGFGPPAETNHIGSLGKYQIERELGRGGMGVVYAATDSRLKRMVALKVMASSKKLQAAAKGRFIREATAAARVKHDNVVTIYEADEINGTPYIAMECLAGESLDSLIKRLKTPPTPLVLRIAVEAVSGLNAAHRLGLVHRDLKPSNIWIEAATGRVKLLDFGLAKEVMAPGDITAPGSILGTPAFMSPEQARGKAIDHRSDIFSLGAVFYLLCTGEAPFRGKNAMEIVMSLATDEPRAIRELNPEVPVPFAELVQEMLNKDVALRPHSSSEVARRLLEIVSEFDRERPYSATYAVASIGTLEVPPTPMKTQTDVIPGVTGVTESAAPQTQKTLAEAGQKSGGRRGAMYSVGAIAAGFAIVAGLLGITIVIRNKDGSETRIVVPDGATVEIKENEIKENMAPKTDTAKPSTAKKSLDAARDPERTAAEWVLLRGGTIAIEGIESRIVKSSELPKTPFRVWSVDLAGKSIIDSEFAVINDLPHVIQLDASNTGLGDSGIKHLKDHPRLAKLNLGHTRVTDVSGEVLASHKFLEELTLTDTTIGNTTLRHLRDSKKLRVLNICRTSVSSTGLAYLADLPVLEELLLEGTAIEDRDIAPIADCRGLKKLWLSVTSISDEGCKFLNRLPNLRDLNLAGTVVGDAGIKNLGKIATLEVLALNNTRVADEGLLALTSCENLCELTLMNTNVSDAGMVHLAKLLKLKTLGLGGTKVTDEGLKNLVRFEGLRVLNLEGLPVTDQGLRTLAAIPSLETIVIWRTKATPSGVVELRKLLPKCHVFSDESDPKDGALSP